MPPYYHRPQNTLKRAEELIKVDKSEDALQAIHEALRPKSRKAVDISALEPLVMKFVDLCVDLRRHQFARDGINQFRHVAQNTNVPAISNVIGRFLNRADKRLKEAQTSAREKGAIELAKVEDLESPETPESILMSAVSSQALQDRMDREVLMPWLKFSWEAHRSMLEAMRNNVKLEQIYQNVATRAFRFCLANNRRTELRRLCELMRSHLSASLGSTHVNAINILEPDTLLRHLEIRFLQLQTTTELEMWQEGFKSVEEVYTLMLLGGFLPPPENGAPLPQTVATFLNTSDSTQLRNFRRPVDVNTVKVVEGYYSRLTTLFSVGTDATFSAACWSKANIWSKKLRALGCETGSERQTEAATHAMLSTCAVPIFPATLPMLANVDTGAVGLTNLMAGIERDEIAMGSDPWSSLDTETSVRGIDAKLHMKRLKTACYLGMSQVPTRECLVRDIRSNKLHEGVQDKTVLEIFKVMELEFHPLTAAKRLDPLLEVLKNDDKFARYAQSIAAALVQKVISEVATLYRKISLAHLQSLTAVKSFPLAFATLEKFILVGCRRGDFTAAIDHDNNLIEFRRDSFTTKALLLPAQLGPPGGHGQASSGKRSPLKVITGKMSYLAQRLDKASELLQRWKIGSNVGLASDEVNLAKIEKRKAQALELAKEFEEREHQEALARRIVIERKKEIHETLLMRREKEQAHEKALQMRQEHEAAKAKLQEESQRREQQRIKRETDEIKKEETRKAAESLRQTSGVIISEQDLDQLDAETLLRLRTEQLEKGKQEKTMRVKKLTKTLDHLDRALRKSEIALLERQQESQRVVDKKVYDSMKAEFLKESETAHLRDRETRDRLSRMSDVFIKYKKEIETKRRDEFAQRRKLADRNIAQEKMDRRNLVRNLLREERDEVRKEQEEEIRRIEEEKRKAEQAKREAEEAERRREEQRQKQEALQKKLDEQEEKRKQRLREIEEKERLREEEEARERQAAQQRAEKAASEQFVRGKGYETKPSPVPATSNTSEEWRKGAAYVPPTSSPSEERWQRGSASRLSDARAKMPARDYSIMRTGSSQGSPRTLTTLSSGRSSGSGTLRSSGGVGRHDSDDFSMVRGAKYDRSEVPGKTESVGGGSASLATESNASGKAALPNKRTMLADVSGSPVSGLRRSAAGGGSSPGTTRQMGRGPSNQSLEGSGTGLIKRGGSSLGLSRGVNEDKAATVGRDVGKVVTISGSVPASGDKPANTGARSPAAAVESGESSPTPGDPPGRSASYRAPGKASGGDAATPLKPNADGFTPVAPRKGRRQLV